MTCAANAEGWKTNSVCLLSGNIIPQLTAGSKIQRELEQSADQVPDTKYAKNAKPTPGVRPFIDYSSDSGGGTEAADGPLRNCGTVAAVVSTAAVVWQGAGGTNTGSASSRPQTADFIFLETYSQQTPTAAAAAAQQLYTTQKKT